MLVFERLMERGLGPATLATVHAKVHPLTMCFPVYGWARWQSQCYYFNSYMLPCLLGCRPKTLKKVNTPGHSPGGLASSRLTMG